jgi:hypothetical protein
MPAGIPDGRVDQPERPFLIDTSLSISPVKK